MDKGTTNDIQGQIPEVVQSLDELAREGAHQAHQGSRIAQGRAGDGLQAATGGREALAQDQCPSSGSLGPSWSQFPRWTATDLLKGSIGPFTVWARETHTMKADPQHLTISPIREINTEITIPKADAQLSLISLRVSEICRAK